MALSEDFYNNLKEEIEPYFKEKASHGFDHTQRVYNLALKIAENEDVDLDFLRTAVLLHDIARYKQFIGEVECHAEAGAIIAKELLIKLEFPEDKIDEVCNAIRNHRYSKGVKPQTKEEKILQDADRLDALGAVCIARVFSYGGLKGKELYNPMDKIKNYTHNSESASSFIHFYEKILKIKPETFHTKKAQEIAKGRYDFIVEFLDRFKKEWEGEI